MSALETVTSFETVQFVIIVGIAAVGIVGLVMRYLAKRDAVKFDRDKEKRGLEHDYALEVIKAKAVSSALPGKANPNATALENHENG